jgi:cellulose synthase/poly-beta-1,6-N-acetylglucosamine synthase-like glycosyltransferase
MIILHWGDVVTAFAWFIAVYMVIVISFYSVILVISFFQLRKEYQLDRVQAYEDYSDEFYTKPVSIIVPVYNEEAGIVQSVRSLLSVNYPTFEVVVVNDGSTDHTLEKVIEHYGMKEIKKVVRKQVETKPIGRIYQSDVLSNLFLIDKENGGKADALNVGLNFSHYPYFCSLDGDSVLEPDAFLKVMKPIIDSNEEVVASGGSVRIANGCQIINGHIQKIGLSNKPLVVMQIVRSSHMLNKRIMECFIPLDLLFLRN